MNVTCPNDHRAEVELINCMATRLQVVVRCRQCRERFVYRLECGAPENLDATLRGKEKAE